MRQFSGTGVALVTPFHKDGTIDFDGLKRLLGFTSKGVDYFVVLGTTGESATLTAQEKSEVLSFVKANNPKKVPIVYGIGGNDTKQVDKTIQDANLEGVDAILSVSPYYNKPSQAGIIAHFEFIADRSPRPIILYNVPGRTMSNMTAETTLHLSRHTNIIGIKEASGNLDQCNKITKGMAPDFFLTSGDDLITPDLVKMGSVGVISVLANGFPEEFGAVTRHALEGNFEKSHTARDAFNEINPLMYVESNPVGVKEVLRQKGICSGYVRLPLLEATTELRDNIEAHLKGV